MKQIDQRACNGRVTPKRMNSNAGCSASMATVYAVNGNTAVSIWVLNIIILDLTRRYIIIFYIIKASILFLPAFELNS